MSAAAGDLPDLATDMAALLAGDQATELAEALAKEQRFDDRYRELERVLRDAFLDAREGKGAVRHGNAQAFEEQPMLLVRRLLGPGFTKGQAVKKILEARALEPERAIRELRGAIVYLAGEILALEAEARTA